MDPLSDLERLATGVGDKPKWKDLDPEQQNKVITLRSKVLPEDDLLIVHGNSNHQGGKYGELTLSEKETLWKTLSDLERQTAGVDRGKEWKDLDQAQQDKVKNLRSSELSAGDLRLLLHGHIVSQGTKYGELSLPVKKYLFDSKKDKIKPVYLSKAKYDGLLRYRCVDHPAQSGAWVVLSPEEKEVVDNKFKFLSAEQRNALSKHQGTEGTRVESPGYEKVTEEEWNWLMRTTRGAHDATNFKEFCKKNVCSFGTKACIFILVVHVFVVGFSWAAFISASKHDSCVALTNTVTTEIKNSSVTTTTYSPLVVNETEYKYCEEDKYEYHGSLERSNSLIASVVGTGIQTLTATAVKILAEDEAFIERNFTSLYWGTKVEALLIGCILLSSLAFWCNMVIYTFIEPIHTAEFLQIVGGTVIAAPFAGPFLEKLYKSCVKMSRTLSPGHTSKDESKPATTEEKGETTDIENQTGKT